MNIMKKFKIGLMFIVGVFTINLEANPELGRQYDMACSACHSQVPALNDMGLSFLRNGLRTSKFDTTALKSFIDSNSSKRFYPIGAMIGVSENSKSDNINTVTKLYLTGSLTDSLSLWAASKEQFNPDKDDQKLFESGNSQLYFQYNILEAKHAIRVGLFSPLTQLGNVHRSMGHSGLHGGEGHGVNYFSPLDRANVNKIKGAEYSYLFDNNVLLLASYGEQVKGHHGKGHAYSREDDNDAFLAGVTYRTESSYKVGLIYNHTEVQGDTFYSLILPIEKEFTIFTWNSSLVYANDSSDDYIGLENAFTFPMRDMEHVKVIFNVDNDEFDNNNFGYSLGYTKIYNMFFFEAVASRVNTEAYSSSILRGSVQLIF
ncbi:hypothetical protein [Sulfurovum sp.]|uniref:hypothetical protein n=1 Tax=Sulfurovum sp. TaxID=1969726 RepID=UPI003561C5D4